MRGVASVRRFARFVVIVRLVLRVHDQMPGQRRPADLTHHRRPRPPSEDGLATQGQDEGEEDEAANHGLILRSVRVGRCGLRAHYPQVLRT